MTDQGNETPDAPPPAADPRPRPQYGEYAPPGYVPPMPPPEAPTEPTVEPAQALPTQPSVALRRTPGWDRGLTIGLLVAGLFGALIGWMIGSGLAESLPIALEQYDIEAGAMPEWVDAAGTAVMLSHILLYLAAVGLSIALLRAGRPAFWAPLSAGVIAAIIFWTVMSAAVAPYASQLQP